MVYMVTWIPSIYPSHVSINIYQHHGSYGLSGMTQSHKRKEPCLAMSCHGPVDCESDRTGRLRLQGERQHSSPQFFQGVGPAWSSMVQREDHRSTIEDPISEGLAQLELKLHCHGPVGAASSWQQEYLDDKI